MHTLKDLNKKLLAEKDLTIDKLKNHFDSISLFTRSDNKEGIRTAVELEQQINSLIKSVSRAEGLLEERDNSIGKIFSLFLHFSFW